MEQTKALQGLIEAADLAKLAEELMRPGVLEEISPAGLSGLRLSLRALREKILSGHDILASRLIQEGRRCQTETASEQATEIEGEPSYPRLNRSSLRESIDRMIDSQK